MQYLLRGIGALCAVTSISASARAADHTDSPAVVADPAADIADVYAWVEGGQDLNLIMNIATAAFSDQVQYVFHIESMPAYGMSGPTTTILCRFDVSQRVECWVGEDVYVSGDATGESGISDGSGMVRVHTGLRDDPFFFNISGFGATIDLVKDAAPNLTFDDDGCPALDVDTANALATQLTLEPDGSAGRDDFAGRNVQSLVVQVDRSLVDAGGSILAVWGSTRR